MSYRHYFYAIDLSQLHAIYGSEDSAFVDDMTTQHARRIQEFDDLTPGFGGSIALREIVAGSPRFDLPEDLRYIYGYMLECICRTLGELLPSEAYCVDALPFDSILVANGPPVRIPVTAGDWPQMGHLALPDIPLEIQRIDSVPSLDQLERNGYRRYGNGDATDAIYDLDDYRQSLQLALNQNKSVASFRR